MSERIPCQTQGGKRTSSYVMVYAGLLDRINQCVGKYQGVEVGGDKAALGPDGRAVGAGQD